MLIDTHVHLDAIEFEPDREAVMRVARQAGVGAFVAPAISVLSCRLLAALASQYTDIYPAYGIHPLYVERADPDSLDKVDEYLRQSGGIAVGEIGLDYFVPDCEPAQQAYFFVEQLKLARHYNLPVIIHARRSQDDVLKYLRRFPVAGGIIHAFNGSLQQAQRFMQMGFKLGFGGAMTFEGSKRIRQLAASLPLDVIVLETDAPDMPPAWGQGRRNEPVNLLRFAQLLAELRQMPVDMVVEATCWNACVALPGLKKAVNVIEGE